MNEVVLILGMALLTFIPRYLPFGLAGKLSLPALVQRSLEYIPIAVLTSIIVQTTLIREGQTALSLDNAHLLAATVAFVTSLLTRHLLLTVALGLLSYTILQLIR